MKRVSCSGEIKASLSILILRLHLPSLQSQSVAIRKTKKRKKKKEVLPDLIVRLGKQTQHFGLKLHLIIGYNACNPSWVMKAMYSLNLSILYFYLDLFLKIDIFQAVLSCSLDKQRQAWIPWQGRPGRFTKMEPVSKNKLIEFKIHLLHEDSRFGSSSIQ